MFSFSISLSILAFSLAWCATFCDFCALQAALPEDRSNDEKKYDAQYFLYQPSYDNYSCSASYFALYFKDADAWYTSDPKKGDMIFFDYGSGIAHVGIVEDADGCITTIEGNAGDMVQRKWYDFDDSRIAGFGRPRYDDDEKEDNHSKDDSKPKPEPTPEPDTKEFTVQTYSGNALRLRAEPNTSSEQVGWIDNGTTFEAEEIVIGETIGGIDTWVYYHGGYASGRYLYPTPEIDEPAPAPEPEPEPKPEPIPDPEPIPNVGEEYEVRVNSYLSIRTSPEVLEDNEIGRLYNGAKVIVYTTKDNWGKIGGNLWVCLDYLV